MSNAGSYVSAQEPTPSNLDNIVARPSPAAEYNIPAPDYGTDLSIQGSVSRTGTISGYNSVNPNAEYATDSSVQGSKSNAGIILFFMPMQTTVKPYHSRPYASVKKYL
jgi:hypothetical protein